MKNWKHNGTSLMDTRDSGYRDKAIIKVTHVEKETSAIIEIDTRKNDATVTFEANPGKYDPWITTGHVALLTLLEECAPKVTEAVIRIIDNARRVCINKITCADSWDEARATYATYVATHSGALDSYMNYLEMMDELGCDPDNIPEHLEPSITLALKLPSVTDDLP